MQILSAAQAIAPALERTRRLLFQPFSWPTFFKLCAVAVFTEGLFSNFRISRGAHSHQPGRAGQIYYTLPPEWIAGIAIIILLAVILILVLLYLSVRLRFALFDCVVHQTTRLRTGWRAYKGAAGRFFGLSIVVGLAYLAIAAVALFRFVSSAIRILQSHHGGPVPPGQVFAVLMPLIPIMLFLIALAIIIDLVLRDFMLPHMALDGASAGEAWLEVWDRVLMEPGAFFLYAVLRVLLPLAVIAGLFIVLAIPTLIVFAGPAVLMDSLRAAVAQASPAAAVFLRIIQTAVWIVIAALGVLIAISFGGPLCIAIRNYALTFYGGRYRALGDLLSPPPPMTMTLP